MTKLIIARHGNTFTEKDTPTRVGARTDLPLVKKGKDQAIALGLHLKNAGLTPDTVYSSILQRTKETAQLAMRAYKIDNHINELDIFNEIDYGVDENQTENKVIARIGKDAIDKWDKNAIPPIGWKVNPQQVIDNWRNFAIKYSHDNNNTILIVTSNGIARFAPYITDDFESFSARHPIKLSTGAFGIIELYHGKWRVTEWNTRPILDLCG